MFMIWTSLTVYLIFIDPVEEFWFKLWNRLFLLASRQSKVYIFGMESTLTFFYLVAKKLKTSKKVPNEVEGAKKARKKRDGSAQCHTDAVLCLDWNASAVHILASGSADESVILWDLDEAKPATVIPNFGGMVCYLSMAFV
jgi:WD40 repeat protein